MVHPWLFLAAFTAIVTTATTAFPIAVPSEVTEASNIVRAADVANINTGAPGASLVSVLSTVQLASFTPYTQFARAAYCPSSKITTWNCGGTPTDFDSDYLDAAN